MWGSRVADFVAYFTPPLSHFELPGHIRVSSVTDIGQNRYAVTHKRGVRR